MSAEEKLVQAEAEVAQLKAQVAGMETMLAIAVDVMTDQQFGEWRGRLDAKDKAAR